MHHDQGSASPRLRALRGLCLALCLSLAASAGAAGRPAPRAPSASAPEQDDEAVTLLHSVPAGPGAGLLSLADTVYYGGTVWSAARNRYEALRGGTWTFDSGIGSSIVTTPGGCKPVGYHKTMEGWGEVVVNDLATSSTWRRRPECAIHGSRSMHLGWTQAEAESLCYAAGAGYGSRWNEYLAKTFSYSGSGNVTLNFDYAVAAEPSFDYLVVLVDTQPAGPPVFGTAVEVARYTGLLAGHATFTLHPGTELPTVAGPVRVLFHGVSDDAYDDSDGLYPTTCGLATLDDITLGGALVDAGDFETSTNGWANLPHDCDPGGALADLRALSTLPAPVTCAGQCAMSDSVLLFADPLGKHPASADEFAASPWIDLEAAGDMGRSGRLVEFDGSFDLPLLNRVYVMAYVQFYPYVCPVTGDTTASPWIWEGFPRFPGGGVPYCTQAGAPYRIDLSSVIPPAARQVRIGIGIRNYCPSFSNCTGVTNSTPWFDNIRFGVYERRPTLTATPLTDAFSTDGYLNPTSVARVDAAYRPAVGRALGDTLVASGDGGNQEVRVNFRVRPGPFTDPAALAAWAAAKWTSNPAVGPGWWSARMDTAELSGSPWAGQWMTTLHESDPKFGGGTDRDRGGDGDPAQLSHDIFPDHVLTPGARIDYFLSAHFLPPDPRNPDGDLWAILPDTTGGHYLEMEILPSSMAADTTWNCVLYVNGHATNAADPDESVEEAALDAHLGAGGANAEGTRFDRYDRVRSEVANSLGRGAGAQDGASVLQISAYKIIAWSSSNSPAPGDADVGTLTGWLNAATPALPRSLWLAGNYVANAHSPAQTAFRRDVLGLIDANSRHFTQTCNPLQAATEPHFANSTQLDLRQHSGCAFTFDYYVSEPGGAPGAKAQMKASQQSYIMAVSRIIPTTGARTLVDFFPPADLREGGAGCPTGAGLALTARTADVLTWFGLPARAGCTVEGVSAVPPPLEVTPSPPLELTAVTPLSAGGGWKIAFTLPARSAATLRLFDVTGRVVRTLLDAAPFDAGAQEIAWDGRSARGERVAAGLYFLRLSVGGEARTRKLVVRE